MALPTRFNYYDYEMKTRELDVVKEHLRSFIDYFTDCRHVVDIGCGSGVFLRLLRKAEVNATGIDNDMNTIEFLRTQKLDVIMGNASSVWEQINFEFDGVFCSHLVEHLDFETIIDLIEGISKKIKTGGIAVLAFPNPESLQMQLFQFWTDPQHVRFYHSRIIQAVLRHYEFDIINAFDQGHWGPVNDIRTKKSCKLATTMRTFKKFLPSRKIGNILKEILSIRDLEIEADYIRTLRQVGREAVIVARKLG